MTTPVRIIGGALVSMFVTMSVLSWKVDVWWVSPMAGVMVFAAAGIGLAVHVGKRRDQGKRQR